MTPLESIIYMIWRGVAIGVLISAPMGPVGILCIQRTLDKGRHAGFYTGVGAAISDFIYCLLTGFGLSFIEDFIESNQNVIQLVGSVVLIAFSVYLFRKEPVSPLRRPVTGDISVKKNILGGFLFTFSNPLIMFLIIGLFARFNFTSPDIKAPYMVIGYLFIAGGALGWWYGITYAINKVRTRFNMRAMKIMNTSIGVVILIFAAVGIVSSITGLTSGSAQAHRRHVSTEYLHPTADSTAGTSADNAAGISADNAATTTCGEADVTLLQPGRSCTFPLHGAREMQFDFKARADGHGVSLVHRESPPWRVTLVTTDADTICLDLHTAHDSTESLSPESILICDASSTGGICVSARSALGHDHVNPSGWNHFRLTASPEEGIVLMAGERRLSPMLSLDFADSADAGTASATDTSNRADAATTPGTAATGFASVTISGGRNALELRDLRISRADDAPRGFSDPEMTLRRIAASSDPAEGVWEVLDWQIDTRMALRGGHYRLATLRRPDGDYDIIYLSGAMTLSHEWTPGMTKGRLHAEGIPNTFRLTWIDAEGDVMRSNQNAQIIPSQQLMILSFPYLQSSMRLYKVARDRMVLPTEGRQ